MVQASPGREEHIDVFVVDPRPADYAQVAASCAGDRFVFQFAADANSAMRLRRTGTRAVWLVNLNLPDMSGLELMQSLKSRDRKAIVFLIGEQYAAEDEMQCRCAGAGFYACKPADRHWLAPWSAMAEREFAAA